MTYDRSTFYGIDPEYTRESGRQMDANAEGVGQMVDSISALLQDVLWLGPGAQRFKSEWDGCMQPQMRAAQQCLSENAAEMRRRADLQEEASR